MKNHQKQEKECCSDGFLAGFLMPVVVRQNVDSSSYTKQHSLLTARATERNQCTTVGVFFSKSQNLVDDRLWFPSSNPMPIPWASHCDRFKHQWIN